jgi:hypothetical protein
MQSKRTVAAGSDDVNVNVAPALVLGLGGIPVIVVSSGIAVVDTNVPDTPPTVSVVVTEVPAVDAEK